MDGINSVEQLEKYRYWIDERGDVWELRGYFDGPSATIENTRTKECLTSGVGSLNFQGFTPKPEPLRAEFECKWTKVRASVPTVGASYWCDYIFPEFIGGDLVLEPFIGKPTHVVITEKLEGT